MRRQRDAAHILFAERFHGHDGRERRIDSSAQPKHGRFEAAFVEIIAQTQHQCSENHFLIGQGTSLYVATKERLTRYDLIAGGVSRSFGDDTISTLTGYIQGVASVRGNSLRIAPHLHTTESDIDRLLESLPRVAEA